MTPEQNRRFYVYTLVDPRCGSVFYVGKGQGKRVSAHVAEWRRGEVTNQAKFDRIGAIMDAGLVPMERIVERGLLESEAFKQEAELIAALGRDTLTNFHAAGDPNAALRRKYQWVTSAECFGRACLLGGRSVWLWAQWVIFADAILNKTKIEPDLSAAMDAVNARGDEIDGTWAAFMREARAGVALA